MNTIQRWRPTKGDINKIKMEASDSGEYVRYASYLDECEKLRVEVERLRAENAKKDEWIKDLGAAVDRLGEDWAKQYVELLQQSAALEMAKEALEESRSDVEKVVVDEHQLQGFGPKNEYLKGKIEQLKRHIAALAAIEALPAAPKGGA